MRLWLDVGVGLESGRRSLCFLRTDTLRRWRYEPDTGCWWHLETIVLLGKMSEQQHQGRFTCSSQYRKVAKAKLYLWSSVFQTGPRWISGLSCLCIVCPRGLSAPPLQVVALCTKPSHASVVTQMLFQERLIDYVPPIHSLVKPGVMSSGLLGSRPEALTDRTMNTPWCRVLL